MRVAWQWARAERLGRVLRAWAVMVRVWAWSYLDGGISLRVDDVELSDVLGALVVLDGPRVWLF